jgi:predicted PhzF superfamily epimerase YddE/YHI9
MMPVLGLSEGQASRVKFVRRASCGLGWVYACLHDTSLVEGVKSAADRLQAWSTALKKSLNEEGHWIHGIVTFAIDEQDKGKDLSIRARVFFAEEDGPLVEDPATGSAALGYV